MPTRLHAIQYDYLLYDKTALEPVHEDKEKQPDHVHEMPIPCNGLETEMIVGSEVTGHALPENNTQHDEADRYMKTVKAGQRKERRTIDTRAESEVEVGISLVEFPRLQNQKDQSK